MAANGMAANRALAVRRAAGMPNPETIVTVLATPYWGDDHSAEERLAAIRVAADALMRAGYSLFEQKSGTVSWKSETGNLFTLEVG